MTIWEPRPGRVITRSLIRRLKCICQLWWQCITRTGIKYQMCSKFGQVEQLVVILELLALECGNQCIYGLWMPLIVFQSLLELRWGLIVLKLFLVKCCFAVSKIIMLFRLYLNFFLMLHKNRYLVADPLKTFEEQWLRGLGCVVRRFLFRSRSNLTTLVLSRSN